MRRFLSIALLAALPVVSSAADAVIPPYQELAALDFPSLKVALEKAGWPSAHVQAFLNAEIQHRIDPPRKITPADFRPFQFWRTGPDAEPLAQLNTPELRTERARREEAIRVQFDSLFPPADQDPDKLLLAWDCQRKWGSLPEAKRLAVTSLLSKAEKERDTLMHRCGGILSATEHRQLWKLAEGTRSELAHLLTPEELLDYDLRNSSTANRMRSELDNFQPTHDEFLALFKLRHPLELQFEHKAPGLDLEVDRQRAETETNIEKAIARLLGPTRYDDYKLSLQPACQTLQFDGRFAHADAASVRNLYRSFLAAQASIQSLDSLPEKEKQTALAKIKEGLHHDFRLVFDEEGTRRYLQEQGLWP